MLHALVTGVGFGLVFGMLVAGFGFWLVSKITGTACVP